MKKGFIVIFILLLVFLLCACSAEEQKESKLPTITRTEEVATKESSFDLPPDVPTEYIPVLMQYQEIARIVTSDDLSDVYDGTITLPRPDGVYFDGWASGLLGWASVPARLGYLVKDINGDGILELFWVREDYEILLAFTLVDGKPVALFSSCPRNYLYVSDSGKVIHFSSGGATCTRYVVMSLPPKSDVLMVDEIVDYDRLLYESGESEALYRRVLWDEQLNYFDLSEAKFETLEKTPITQEDFNEFQKAYAQNLFPTETWKQLPIYFI